MSARSGAIISLIMWIFASALAVLILTTTNPYNGANIATAAVASCLFYLLGIVAAIQHLRCISRCSVLGWVALTLNVIPFAFAALLIGIGVAGYW